LANTKQRTFGFLIGSFVEADYGYRDENDDKNGPNDPTQDYKQRKALCKRKSN
jgi:hypothetical protein